MVRAVNGSSSSFFNSFYSFYSFDSFYSSSWIHFHIYKIAILLTEQCSLNTHALYYLQLTNEAFRSLGANWSSQLFPFIYTTTSAYRFTYRSSSSHYKFESRTSRPETHTHWFRSSEHTWTSTTTSSSDILLVFIYAQITYYSSNRTVLYMNI